MADTEENKTGEGNGSSKPPILQNSAEPPKPKTEEVNVSNLTQENPNTIEVDWGAGEQGKENAFFEGPTKPVDAPKTSGPSSAANTVPNGASFEIGIKVMIAIIDFIMSNVLSKIAGDKSTHSYTADKASKENLKDALMMIMEQNRVKIPAWLIALFAFLAAYGFQIMAAIDSRKEKNSQKKNPTSTSSVKEALKPGVFEKDGKLYRRYANGSVHERKFKPDGTEIVIGQPSRRRLNEAA